MRKRVKALIKLAKDKKLASETIDVCLPGNRPEHGKKHPITTVLNDLKDIFIGMGFTIAEGPEVELDYYNFEALNLPPDHPCKEIPRIHFTSMKILCLEHRPLQFRLELWKNSSPPYV